MHFRSVLDLPSSNLLEGYFDLILSNIVIVEMY